MELDGRLTTKQKCRIHHLGLAQREVLVIQSIFRIEPKLNDQYTFGESTPSDPADILFVDADNPESIKAWEKHASQYPAAVPILVSGSDIDTGGATLLKRPLAFRKFVQILDAITSTNSSRGAQHAPSGALRVLVVDDSFPARQFMKLKLDEVAGKNIELSVDFAENGEKTLEAVGSADYDLIFLDVIMPGMNGYEICEKIRPRTGARIAMLTGQTLKADQARGKAAGCDHYISKPPRDTELADIMKLAWHTRVRNAS